MPLLRSFILLALIVPLAACQQVGEGSRDSVERARTALDDTQDAIERVFYYKPEVEEYKPIPYTFCYQVLQDVNCYNQPIAEARGRLVGWQGRGEFKVEDPQKLPARTALVRQPRAMDTRTTLKRVVGKEEKEAEPEMIALEPVFIPKAPEVKAEKTVTIKATAPASDALY